MAISPRTCHIYTRQEYFMSVWDLVPTNIYERQHKLYVKKHPIELIAVLDNLDKYFEALRKGAESQFINAQYIHHEPKGIKALDQSGKKRGKLKQTRLYVYPDEAHKHLHLITIGDKSSQKADIQLCSDYVVSLKGEADGKKI